MATERGHAVSVFIENKTLIEAHWLDDLKILSQRGGAYTTILNGLPIAPRLLISVRSSFSVGDGRMVVWVHEIGYRLTVRRDGPQVRCFTRG